MTLIFLFGDDVGTNSRVVGTYSRAVRIKYESIHDVGTNSRGQRWARIFITGYVTLFEGKKGKWK